MASAKGSQGSLPLQREAGGGWRRPPRALGRRCWMGVAPAAWWASSLTPLHSCLVPQRKQVLSGINVWASCFGSGNTGSGQALQLRGGPKSRPGIRTDCCSFLDCWGVCLRPGPGTDPRRPSLQKAAVCAPAPGTRSLGGTCYGTEARLRTSRLSGLVPGPTVSASQA